MTADEREVTNCLLREKTLLVRRNSRGIEAKMNGIEWHVSRMIIYKTTVTRILMYGSEMWVVIQKDVIRIQAAEIGFIYES